MNELINKEDVWDTLSVEQRRQELLLLGELCKENEEENSVQIDMEHYKCNGIYAREMKAPAGALIVGKIHRRPQINVISKGTVRVATDEGIETITGPSTFICPAGTKRAVLVLEDVTWTTFHETESDDMEVITKELIADSYEELNLLENKHDLGIYSSGGSNHNLHSDRSKKSQETG